MSLTAIENTFPLHRENTKWTTFDKSHWFYSSAICWQHTDMPYICPIP